MGVSLHYRGQLANLDDWATLQDELIDIATTLKWEWTTLDEDWTQPATAKLTFTDRGAEIVGHLPLRGIQLILHPQCESVAFFFDPAGHVRDVMTMLMLLEREIEPEHAWVSVKTQFAPPVIHITLVKLLQYLKKRYLPNLEVRDEGEYWETGDAARLEHHIQVTAKNIDTLEQTFAATNINFSQYAPEDMADIIEAMIRKNLGLHDNA